MKRSTRLLLILAPLVLLLLGVPLGVTLAQRGTPQDATGGILVNVAATATAHPFLGPRQPTRAPRLGPPVPTRAPIIGPRAPTYAPHLGPSVPTSAPAAVSGTPNAVNPAATSSAQNGLSGTVIAIEADRFTVFTKAQRVAVVIVDSGATIRFRNTNVTLDALMIGDNVTVLGHRDAANAFHASLIRVVRLDPTTTPDK